MIDNKQDLLYSTYDTSPINEKNMTVSHAALLADLEQVFTEARPRLLRLVRLNGMSPDIADDIVQETMMEAWRHVEKLRDPQRMQSWLDGICRNVCRRYQTANGTQHLHESLSTLTNDEETTNADDALLDPTALDPAEELSQRDLATLLDRAMGHLAPDTRKLLEMSYLAEMPQREVALQMGMSIGALELRLHRARKKLRQVLSSNLRADAESFGLALDPLQAQGWRETRLWCWLCGKQSIIGIFETEPNGRVAMRLRCPACFDQYRFDVINSHGLVSLEGLSSFRPALKRLFQNLRTLFYTPLTQGNCFQCHEPAQISIIDSNSIAFPVPPDHYWIRTICPKCGISATDISTIYIAYPDVLQFMDKHERCIMEPCQLLEYKGRPAICVRLTDVTSAEQLTIFLDTHNLQLLAAF